MMMMMIIMMISDTYLNLHSDVHWALWVREGVI